MPIGDTYIQFCGVTFGRVKLSSRLPVPQPRSRQKEHFMSESASGPGIRVIEPLGAHMSYSDIKFRLELLTPGNLTTLMNAFLNYRQYQTLTIGNPTVGNATYQVLFAENGFVPDFMDDLSDYEDEYPYAADILVKVLRRTA